MASQFQVNIQIAAGADFYQTFVITESDFTPANLTGNSFMAVVAKHSNSIDVTDSGRLHQGLLMDTEIVNPLQGEYAIMLNPTQTQTLEEGKYVYSVIMTDNNGAKQEVVQGLAFVDKAFGGVFSQDAPSE